MPSTASSPRPPGPQGDPPSSSLCTLRAEAPSPRCPPSLALSTGHPPTSSLSEPPPPPPAAYALARVYGVDSDLSEVARRGSGSACRSLYGGFVEWQMGERPDGKDSVARQVAPESHWPELRVLILVVSGGPSWGREGLPRLPGPRAR